MKRQRDRGPLADEAAQRRLEAVLEEKRARYDADLQAVMDTPAGRRFVWRLIDDTTGVFASSFTGNSETFYKEGRRSVGLDVMREAQRVASPDFVRMYQEALAQQQQDELRRQAAEEAEDED